MMMHNRKPDGFKTAAGALNVLGFTILALIFGLVLAGCPTDGGGDDNNPSTMKVATPTASPAAGTYDTAQSVTLSCATSGAAIHYTTDGSAPTASSTAYTAAISVSTTTTIKAIAVKNGMTDSDVLTAAYTISSGGDPNKAATPTASPAAGTYDTAQSVTLSCTTSGAAIHYTTDGSAPTASSTAYTAAISVSTTTTIKAIAVKNGMTDSDVLTAAYTISAGVVNYTVSFSAGTGSGTPPASQTAAAGSSIRLPDSTGMTPPSGQTFDGWQAQGDVKYAAGDSYTVTGNVTFIAQWAQSGPTYIPLSDGVWTSGSIDSTSDVKRYSFYATGGTYHISWKDANGGGGGDGTYTCNVNVFGFREDGTLLFSGDDGIQYPQTISGYTGQVSILVEGVTFGENRTGTFVIKYQSGALGTIKVVNGSSAYSITVCTILDSDRATVLINHIGPISGNYDETVEVSPGTYYVWVRIGSGVDSAYSSAITVTSGGTKTVRYTGSALQVQ